MNLDQPEEADLPHRDWKCEECGASNSCIDGDCQYCEGPPVEPEPPAFYTVAIYLEDRAYGGPEEGGWYYDCGQRVDNPDEHGERDVPKMFTDKSEACAFALLVNGRLEEGVNRTRRPISSVLSTGRYAARVCDLYPEPHFPATKPHYE